MRAAIKRLDELMRRRLGVFEFTEDDACIFRLQLKDAPCDIQLSDGTSIREGEPILGLHLWNEHIPPIGPAGADLAWAARFARQTIRSLRAIAAWIEDRPEMADRRVLGGATVLIDPDTAEDSPHLLLRLGFEIFPFRNALGRFGEFWENFYTWLLMWAYNQASLRTKQLLGLRRALIWLPIDKLLAKYGSESARGAVRQAGPEGG